LCRMGLLADGMLPWQSRRRVVRPQVSPRSPAPRLRPPGRHTHPVADPAGKPRQCRTVHTDNAAGRRTVRRAAALTGALMLVTVVGCWSPDAGRPRPPAPGLTRLLRPWSVPPIGRPTITTTRGPVSPRRCLRRQWSGHAELDGAVYGQPLVIGNQVIAATENDSVYALSALDGHRWCGRCRWVSRCPVRTAGLAVLVSHVVRSRRGR